VIHALVIAWREVRSYLKDKGDLAFTLILPIGIFALMYGAFGSSSLFHGTAYIVNQDQGGQYSTILIDRLSKLDNLDVNLISDSEAESKLQKAVLQLVTYIPPDFSRNIAGGKETKLVFRQRGNGGQEGQIVASIIRSKVQEIGQEAEMEKAIQTASGTTLEHVDNVTQKYLDRESISPFVTVKETPVGASPQPVNQFLSGIITMFVLFASSLTSRGLVEERRNKTLERLLTTRLTLAELFAGKFLANTSRAFVQSTILLLLAWVVFRIFTPLSFLEALVIAVIFSAASGALGLFIGSLSNSPDQANWLGVLITMSMTMLGGTFFTIEKGSSLYLLSRFSLNTYANDAFRAVISRGENLAGVSGELYLIAGATIGILVFSRFLFKAVR
jgi:ABC-2 type transport system permease protein